MNKTILVGRLVNDPEVKYTQTGKTVASFRLAVNRRFNKNAVEGQPNVDFVPIVAWNKLAEICGTHLIKGRQILVEGRLQVRNYDAQDGSKRYVTEVIAQEIEFIGSKPHEESDVTGVNSFGSEVFPDEEIPF